MLDKAVTGLDADALNLLFTEARTQNGWQDRAPA
jgi:hypothetical protein